MPQRRGAPALRRARGFGLRPTDSAPAGAAFLRGAGGASRAVAAAGARGSSPISGAVALPWWRHVALALDWWWRACTALQPVRRPSRRLPRVLQPRAARPSRRRGRARRAASGARLHPSCVLQPARACAAAGGADLALTSTREQAARVARLLCCESRNEQMEINSAREVGRGCLAARGERAVNTLSQESKPRRAPMLFVNQMLRPMLR